MFISGLNAPHKSTLENNQSACCEVLIQRRLIVCTSARMLSRHHSQTGKQHLQQPPLIKIMVNELRSIPQFGLIVLVFLFQCHELDGEERTE